MYKYIHIYICPYTYSHIHTYPLYPFIHIHCIHTYICIHTYVHSHPICFHWVLKPHEWHAYFAIPSATSPSNDLSGSFWCIPHCLTPWELFVMQPIHTLACFFLGTALISPLLRFAQVTVWSRSRTDISTYYGIAFCPLIIIHSSMLILRACWMATQDRVVVVVISCWPEQVHIPNDVEVPVAKWS